MADRRTSPLVDDALDNSTELALLRAQVRALKAQLAPTTRGRGRFALELDAAEDHVSAEVARLRARAERAEAALADLRRDSARAIVGLKRRERFWQLVAGGIEPATAARQAGLDGPLNSQAAR